MTIISEFEIFAFLTDLEVAAFMLLVQLTHIHQHHECLGILLQIAK
jgi:hypothetical protein